MPPAIDLDLIKTFLTVVERKGFKPAAEQLHRTPAAISQLLALQYQLQGAYNNNKPATAFGGNNQQSSVEIAALPPIEGEPPVPAANNSNTGPGCPQSLLLG